MKVLVTNGNSRMALCIARELKKKRHEVIVADYVQHAMCFFSNHIAKYFAYPSPYSEPYKFIKKIKEQIKIHHIDVILPIHEETFLLSKHIRELEKIVSVPIPNYESILMVHNKNNLFDLLKNHDINTPKTFALEDFDDFDEIRKELSGRIVVKPRQGGGNWGLFLPDPHKKYSVQVEEYLTTTKIDVSRVLVQDWVPVKEKYSHVVIYQKGKLVQDFADVHIRDFPVRGGAGTLRRSCESSPMTHISKRLFDSIGWHGIAEVEYVTHAETGEYYLIEINPRVWGGINSAISSGLDIVGIMLNISRGVNVSAGSYEIGRQTRWFWGDIRVFPEYFAKSNNKISALCEYIKLMFDGTKTDEFFWNDPVPFFVWPGHAIYKMLKYRSFSPVSYDSLTGEWD